MRSFNDPDFHLYFQLIVCFRTPTQFASSSWNAGGCAGILLTAVTVLRRQALLMDKTTTVIMPINRDYERSIIFITEQRRVFLCAVSNRHILDLTSYYIIGFHVVGNAVLSRSSRGVYQHQPLAQLRWVLHPSLAAFLQRISCQTLTRPSSEYLMLTPHVALQENLPWTPPQLRSHGDE